MQKVKLFGLMLSAMFALAALFSASAWATSPPENTSPPTITPKSPAVGSKALGGKGLWKNGVESYAYQWERCSSTGSECVNISGATAQSYPVVEADHGHTLVLQVTATNTAGKATASSTASGVVTPISYPELTPAPSAERPLTFTGEGPILYNGSNYSFSCYAHFTGSFVGPHTAKGITIKNECSPNPWFTSETLEGTLGWVNEAKKQAAIWLKPEAAGSNVFINNYKLHGGVLTGSVFGEFVVSGLSTEAHILYQHVGSMGQEQKILGFESFTEPQQLYGACCEQSPTKVGISGEPRLKFPTRVEVR